MTAGARGMLRVNTCRRRRSGSCSGCGQRWRAWPSRRSSHRPSGTRWRDSAKRWYPRGHRWADFAAKLESDLGFHLLLCQLSGNSMLVDAWRNLEGRIRVTIMNDESAGSPR